MSTRWRPCHYLQGQCPYGERCMFGHNGDTHRLDHGQTGKSVPTVPRPDISTHVFNVKTVPLCKYYGSGSCIYGDSCRNRHEIPTVAANSICEYDVSGTCMFGAACRFVHSSSRISSTASLNDSPVFVSKMNLPVIIRLCD